MELRDVETFLVLAEELHFGRTAKRLHLTQGRVSQTIRALEREVGSALFDRTSRSVRLTAIGQRFLVGARRGYDELTQALREAREAARGITGDLRVGYLPSVGGGLLTQLAGVFEQRHPRCRLILSALASIQPAAVGMVLRPDIDIALIWSPRGVEPVSGIGQTVGPVLGTVARGVLVPTGHPLAGQASVSVEDLADYEMLNPSNTWTAGFREAWTPTVTPAGRPIRHTTEDVAAMTGRVEMTTEDLLTLVARGRGLHCTVMTLLDRFPFPGLTVVPIRDLPPMAVVPVWQTAAENATVRAFVEVASEALMSDGNRNMSN